MVLLDQNPIANGLFNGVQILTLQVFDHGQLGCGLVVRLNDGDGNLPQACQTGGAPAALTGDDLIVTAVQFPDCQGLDHTVDSNGI